MPSQDNLATRALAVELRFVGGHQAGKRMGVHGPDPVAIGNDGTAGVRLQGHGVSPIHGWVHLSSDGTVVFEDCSDQGSDINGRFIRGAQRVLNDADRITIGRHTIEVRLCRELDEHALVATDQGSPSRIRLMPRFLWLCVRHSPVLLRMPLLWVWRLPRGIRRRRPQLPEVRADIGSERVTKSLMVAWSVLGILWIIAQGGRFPTLRRWLYALTLSPAAVLDSGCLWQLLTYSLVHGGFLHLLLNCAGLYFLGMPLERRWGSRYFVLFFAGGVLGGSCATVVGAYLVGDWLSLPEHVVVLGGSGGLCAITVAFVAWQPTATFYLYLLPVRAWNLLVILVGMDVIGLFVAGSPVAHVTHIGGGLAGFCIVWFTPLARRP